MGAERAPLIVLLYPRVEPDMPHGTKLLGLPLPVLTLARPLVDADYEVQILDENAEARPLERLDPSRPPVFFGISCIGGHQITSGLRLARTLGRRFPGVPRVWGGWNPTLLPGLYERDDVADAVDVIVRGRAEHRVVELARRLKSGAPLDGLVGLAWREPFGPGGVVRRTADAEFVHDPVPPRLPYELIHDLGAYSTRQGVLNYMSSWGCPHRCGFCGIPVGTRTFRPLHNEVVLEHLGHAARELAVRTVVFFDDNFFTSKERVLDLARRLIDSGLGLAWHSNGRLDQVSTLDAGELALLRRSGCRSINIGYETGEQAVADDVDKDIQVGDIFALARAFAAADIVLSLNFMVGLPAEDEGALVRSLETLKAIHALQPALEVCWYIFMPPPHTPLWQRLVADGRLSEPNTLAEHVALQSLGLEYPWFYRSPPAWVFREWRARHKAVAWYFHTAYAAGPPAWAWLRPGHRALRRWCRWRFERRRFRLRLDWRAAYLAHHARERLRWAWAVLRRSRWAARFGGPSAPGRPRPAALPLPWAHGST